MLRYIWLILSFKKVYSKVFDYLDGGQNTAILTHALLWQIFFEYYFQSLLFYA